MSVSSESTAGRLQADLAHTCGETAEPIRVNSPAGLLAAVPLLLGFSPSEPSIVVIGTERPRPDVRLTLRYDIPAGHNPAELARHAAAVFASQHLTNACAVGYGPGALVTPAADAIRKHFPAAGISMADVLRVQDGRYWSYLCASPDCCPPEGRPFSPGEHDGQVLASREALAATVAAVTGGQAESMRRATLAVERRAKRLAAAAGEGPGRRSRRRVLLDPGLQAVADAIKAYRAGGELKSHRDAAWLALVLKDLRVRDDAWARMDPAHTAAHQRLWTDLTTLARPGYTAAPAALLAFTAWQSGNGSLANVALDRAQADNPRYSMAELLREALDAGCPPSMARLPMTPEEVAAAYEKTDSPHGEAGTLPGDLATPDS